MNVIRGLRLMCDVYALGQGGAELDQGQVAGQGDPAHPTRASVVVSCSGVAARTVPPPHLVKRCQKCEATKTLDLFYRNARLKDGRAHWCKGCMDSNGFS